MDERRLVMPVGRGVEILVDQSLDIDCFADVPAGFLGLLGDSLDEEEQLGRLDAVLRLKSWQDKLDQARERENYLFQSADEPR